LPVIILIDNQLSTDWIVDVPFARSVVPLFTVTCKNLTFIATFCRWKWNLHGCYG